MITITDNKPWNVWLDSGRTSVNVEVIMIISRMINETT